MSHSSGLRALNLLGLGGLALAATGCPRLDCGEGTEERDGQCVPLLACGEGTHQEGDACVADPPPDTDGDGVADEDDCAPSDPELGEPTAWLPDEDGDGHGDANATPTVACEGAEGAVADATDCDDTTASVHPDAEDRCDGLDNDCDGSLEEEGCPTGPLADTQVTACFDASTVIACPTAGQAYYGQDGNFTRASMVLVDNGDGTVSDEITGLTWMETPNLEGLSWWDAATYCEELTLGGASDWRIPTRYEVSTLADYSGTEPITHDAVSEYWGDQSWSQALWVAEEEYADSVRAYQFYPRDGQEGVNSKTNLETTRCVRGAMPAQSWSDNGDGTLVEESTALMWTAAADGTPYTWEEALAYCQALELAGHDDWRLPDIRELRSTIPNKGISVSLPYWSSTTASQDPTTAWATGYNTRGSYYFSKSSTRWYALCARDVVE